ncbi:MAG: sarcosine oxidase subunit gamma family protein [Woeseia sp.]
MQGYEVSIEIPPRRGLLDLRGNAAIRLICNEQLGGDLPLAANRLACLPGNKLAYCISPDHWLLQVEEGDEGPVLRSLEQAAGQTFHAFTDVSDLYAQIRLSGPDVREVLVQGVSIDIHPRVFPAGSTARCEFAKTTAQLTCLETASVFEIAVYSSYQRYAIDWLTQAQGR